MQTSQQELIPAQQQYDPEEVRLVAKDNLDFFGGLAMPDDCTLAFPDYYVELFRTLIFAICLPRDFSKFAVGFPRGHGKTQFFKLLAIYCILYTDKQFVLVVGASLDRAEDFIKDVWDALCSPNIQAIYGDVAADVSKNTASIKKFTFRGKPRIIAAVGQGTSLRGFNVDNRRPDLMLLDDAQTKDCAASVTEANKFITWFSGTLMKAKSPTGCTYIYVGNMYPDLVVKKNANGEEIFACQLRNLQRNKFWKSFIVGAILADKTALWEELQPLEQLLEEFEGDLSLGQGDVFCAEVLNDPQALPYAGMDFSKVVIKDPVPGELHQGNFTIIDPATDKNGADDTAVGYFQVYDAVPTLIDLESKVLSPQQTIEYVLNHAIAHTCNLICVESVAYQYTLLQWFQFFCIQQKINWIEFQPVHPRGVSKNARILSMFRQLQAGEIALSSKVAPLVFHQIRAFNPKITTNQDDILDILAYSTVVLAEYSGHMVIEGSRAENDWEFQQLPSPDSYQPAF